MHRLLALLAALLFAPMAVAQTFPDQRGPHVNDYADILSDEAEARIAADLDPTLRDHGAQVTIVTLTELRFYTNDLAIADYARGLFDDWQLGQADGSTAILLLILRDDQEMHIRLGEAYDSDWNMTAARVVGEVITPRFAEGDFEAGINDGSIAIRDRIVIPFTTPDSAPPADAADTEGGIGIGPVLGGLGVIIAALFGWGRYRAAKRASEPCPACGATGLQRDRVVVEPATDTTEGRGEARVTCPACGHVTVRSYAIAKTGATPATGGKAGNGGATGKW